MGLLDYDYAEMAVRVQRGLDRLTANYLTAHLARVRRDVVDFHGREHLDFELEHGGHHLRVRQEGPARGIGEQRDAAPEEFESKFDGSPSADAPSILIAEWLQALPAGRAAPEPAPRVTDPANPFLAVKPAPDIPRARSANPFLNERPAAQPDANPFSSGGEVERRKRRALEWLGGDD